MPSSSTSAAASSRLSHNNNSSNNNSNSNSRRKSNSRSNSTVSSNYVFDLLHACEMGDRAAVERLLGGVAAGVGVAAGGVATAAAAQVGVDDRDEEDNTGLQVAAANDQVEFSFLTF